MKKLLFLVVSMLILHSISVSAAASVSSIADINLGNVALGTTAGSSFTLTNNGNVTLTSAQFAFSSSNFIFTPNSTNFNLSNGASENINFSLNIPAVTSTGNVTFGSVSLSSTELNKTLFSIRADVVGGLIIEDLDVFLTTRPIRRAGGALSSASASHLDVADGKKLDFDEEDAGPGSELKFNLNIENTFEDSDNIDIEEVKVKVTIESIDDDEDIEEESSEFDVDSGQSNEADVYVKIPISVVEGRYDLVIEVEGEDTNKNVHTDKMNLELTIKKEPRNVIVTQASLSPVNIGCSGTASLTATIKNLGIRAEKGAGLEIASSGLGINYMQRNIELSEDPFDGDNEFTKILSIDVQRGTKPGIYPITVKSYIEEDAVWETRTADLAVEACSDNIAEKPTKEEEVSEETSEESAETEKPVEVVKQNQEESSVSSQIPLLKPQTTTEIPLTNRPGFWFALVLGNLIVIGGLAYFVVKAYAPKKRNK